MKKYIYLGIVLLSVLHGIQGMQSPKTQNRKLIIDTVVGIESKIEYDVQKQVFSIQTNLVDKTNQKHLYYDHTLKKSQNNSLSYASKKIVDHHMQLLSLIPKDHPIIDATRSFTINASYSLISNESVPVYKDSLTAQDFKTAFTTMRDEMILTLSQNNLYDTSRTTMFQIPIVTHIPNNYSLKVPLLPWYKRIKLGIITPFIGLLGIGTGMYFYYKNKIHTQL